jgi:hypothetical protein
MSSTIHSFYSHSGKFGVQGPVAAIAVGAIAAFPLGFVYSYLIKWIPFIYLNFLITLGYGFLFGFITRWLLKFGKVRNNLVALLSSGVVGLLAWYGSWNGCARALIGSEAPWLLTPPQMTKFVQILLENGSWGIGAGSSTMVTGIPLAIIWICEGAAIVGLTVLVAYKFVAHTPFCELHNCWLDKEKKIDKLDAFSQPDQIAAFKSGDLSPLERAKPRIPASDKFGRLILKHSDQCHDYCGVSVSNITISYDKKGNLKESEEKIISNLWVSKSQFDYLSQFEHATAKAPASV